MKDVNLLMQNGIDVNASLELFGDMETYEETLHDFLSTIDEKVQKIKECKEASDMPNYAILVHSLKSDSKYLGFTTLATLSYDHEMQSKAYQIGYVIAHYEELMQEVERVVNLVNQYFGREDHVTIIEKKANVQPSKKILIVDDSDIIRNLIAKIFLEEFEVVMAKDGQEAISVLNGDIEHKIVGVLLDLNMPNVDGFQVLEYFKMNNLFTKYPVAIVTGEDSKENIERTYHYPIVDVLTKPFNERDVKRVVTALHNFR